MGPISSILRPFLRQEEIAHIFRRVIPEEGSVVEPSLFGDVLGVAAAFFVLDDVVVFLQAKGWDLPGVGVEVCGPAQNRFWKGVDVDGVF